MSYRSPARAVARLEQNIGALNVQLSASDIEQIDRIASKGAVAGARYPTGMAQLLDG
jgi:hypothetical protein